jgi:hypothetical protein
MKYAFGISIVLGYYLRVATSADSRARPFGSSLQLGALEKAVELLERGLRQLFEAANTTNPWPTRTTATHRWRSNDGGRSRARIVFAAVVQASAGAGITQLMPLKT